MEKEKMPGTLKAAYEMHDQISADLKAWSDRVKEGKDQMDGAEWDKWNKMLDDLTQVKKHIQGLESMERMQFEQLHKQEETKTPEKEGLNLDKTFEKFLRFGLGNLNPDELALLQGRAVTDPQSTSTTGGGYLIPYGFNAAIEVAMKPYASVLDACTIQETSEGNTLYWPTVDDTSIKGHLLTEGSTDTVQKVTFGVVTFYAYMFTSYIVKVPLQLLQDSAIDINALLSRLLGERLGRCLSDYFTTGTGSSQPQGIVTGATQASITGVSAAAITRDNVLDLKHSVNSVYRQRGSFMFNDNTFKALAKLTFGTSDDRPLWQGGDITKGIPPMIEGMPYFINDSMADIAAAAKSMLFGDLKKFMIRKVLGTQLFVYREKYMEELQIGFQAYNRWDSRMLDAGQHPIKYLLHSNT
jgi:HK97 family phage major capsid protein